MKLNLRIKVPRLPIVTLFHLCLFSYHFLSSIQSTTSSTPAKQRKMIFSSSAFVTRLLFCLAKAAKAKVTCPTAEFYNKRCVVVKLAADPTHPTSPSDL